MTGKELDHPMRLISQRAVGALKRSWGWTLIGSNGSAKDSGGLSFQRTGYCLILPIEEREHRETMGWLIVEMKVKPVCFDFQSTQHKSSLLHPRSHTVNILRAGPAPLICFTSVASNLSWSADPFTLPYRAVH